MASILPGFAPPAVVAFDAGSSSPPASAGRDIINSPSSGGGFVALRSLTRWHDTVPPRYTEEDFQAAVRRNEERRRRTQNRKKKHTHKRSAHAEAVRTGVVISQETNSDSAPPTSTTANEAGDAPSTPTAPVTPVTPTSPVTPTAPNAAEHFAEEVNHTTDESYSAAQSRFPVEDDLSRRIILWRGDITKLEVDAIVNSTNETLSATNAVAQSIIRAAGPDLRDAYRETDRCRTGEAGICAAYDLPAKCVIHTVGPRYNVKYKTAAENALHSCYRNSLEVLKENGFSTIAFSIVNTPEKGYPLEPAAHVAIRTLRRFLEHWGDGVDTIVLAIPTDRDLRVYSKVLPLYFPRSLEEEVFANASLPDYTGNEYGETVIRDRKIRISSHLVDVHGRARANRFNEALHRAIKLDDDNPFGYHSATVFSEMKEDPDTHRDRMEEKKSAQQKRADAHERRYRQLLKQARQGRYDDLDDLNFIYASGRDNDGYPIVVFVAKQFPAKTTDLNRVLLYCIKKIDRIAQQPYSIVYFHTDSTAENKPTFQWIRGVFQLLSNNYRKNMKRLYVVHPTMWVKLVFWIATPMVSSSFWRKLTYCKQLNRIFEHMPKDSLAVPDHVYEFDTKRFGTRFEHMAVVEHHDEL